MRESKFDFIYKGVNGFHHKQYYLEDLIGKSLANLSDLHHQMELIASRQFTGLKDKNGKEIYEGDIVEWYDVEPNTGGYGNMKRSEIKFSENGVRSGWYVPAGATVIGNIHENPELLK